jgi:hypothetical protein
MCSGARTEVTRCSRRTRAIHRFTSRKSDSSGRFASGCTIVRLLSTPVRIWPGSGSVRTPTTTNYQPKSRLTRGCSTRAVGRNGRNRSARSRLVAERLSLGSDKWTPEIMRRSVALIVGCVLVSGGVIASSCYVATHYNGWRYRGGQLVDNGLFSRPRYEARFPAISFNVSGSYEYSFSRFPADDAYVMLAMESEPSAASIERLTTKVRLSVIDPNGRPRCEATGSPTGKGQAQLVVNSSAGVIGLWHMRCASIQLRTCNPCRLQIAIEQIDLATPAVLLVPTLRGAGYELP